MEDKNKKVSVTILYTLAVLFLIGSITSFVLFIIIDTENFNKIIFAQVSFFICFLIAAICFAAAKKITAKNKIKNNNIKIYKNSDNIDHGYCNFTKTKLDGDDEVANSINASTIVCDKCGYINDSKNVRCKQCGNYLIKMCPKCHHQLESNANSNYCNKCGYKLDDGDNKNESN